MSDSPSHTCPSTPLCCAQDERREESCPSGRTEGGTPASFDSDCAALRTNGGRNPALRLLLPSTPLCCAQDERREESCPSTPASFDSAVLRSGRTEGGIRPFNSCFLRLRCAALRTNGGRNPALQLLLPSTPLCCAQDERREESGPSTPLCCAQDERREESCPSTPASFDSAVLRSGRTEGRVLRLGSARRGVVHCFL